MDLYKDKMSLTNLEKKINSELTTKINSSSINHNHIYLNIDEEDLLDVIIFLKTNSETKFKLIVFFSLVIFFLYFFNIFCSLPWT